MSQATEASAAVHSSRYRYFVWMVIFFAICGLLVSNDYATVWPGGEAWLFWQVQQGGTAPYLPALIMSFLPNDPDLWLFWPRLLSVLLALVSAVLFYRWASPVLGSSTAQLSLLCLATSLFMPSLYKQASGDAWASTAQLVLWLAMVRTLKQPDRKWRLISYLAAALAAWIAPVSTAILALLLMLLLFWRHPQGGALWQRNALVLVVGGVSALVHFGVLGESYVLPVNWTPYVSSYWRFLLSNLLGFLPVIGFLVAGLRDLVFKFRKEEELALILVFSLLATFLAQSLVFGVLLAILAAKQMQLYFNANYPWRDWVRAPAVLHAIVVCIGVFMLLVGGFIKLEGEGFRAIMGCGAAYWAFSFAAVIGLYGVRRDLTIGGSILAGTLATLFFWLQLYPYAELERNWPQRLVKEMSQAADRPTIHLSAEEGFALPAAVYFDKAGFPVALTPDLENLSAAYRQNKPGFYLWPDERWLDVNPYTPWKDQKPALSIQGWYFDWRLGSWSLYEKVNAE